MSHSATTEQKVSIRSQKTESQNFRILRVSPSVFKAFLTEDFSFEEDFEPLLNLDIVELIGPICRNLGHCHDINTEYSLRHKMDEGCYKL